MRHWVYACLGGALLASAQPPLLLWPVAGFALAPWLTAIPRATWTSALIGSFAVGLISGIAVATWIPEALRTLGASSGHSWLALLTIAVWGKALPFALVGLAAYAVRRRGRWVRPLCVASAFSLLEWISSSWRWGLPWGLLGHSQARVGGVAQLALVGGVPLISVLIIGINQSVAFVWEERGSRGSIQLLVTLSGAWLATAVAGLPLAIAMGHERTESDTEAVRLLLVQPDLPRGERWAPELQTLNLQRIATFTERALGDVDAKPDAIVWPENLLTTPIDESSALAGELRVWVDRFGVPLILGATRAAGSPGHYRSSILWVAPGQGTIASMDKTRGVPVVESSANGGMLALAATAFGSAADGLKVDEAEEARELRGTFPLTAVLCYEVLFPDLVATRRGHRSAAILNLADDSWTESTVAREQLVTYASFRAIEQRLPLVRVAHGGISAVVDPFGRVTDRLPQDTYAYAMVRVEPSSPPHFSEKVGLASLPVVTGAGVWWALTPWVRRERARKVDGRKHER